MIHLIGDKVDLKTYTRDEYHTLWKQYIPDPIMDPSTYIYRKDIVDKQFDAVLLSINWYPRLGIFLKDGTVIGELSIKNIDYEKSSCEIGLALMNDTLKGQGYGTDAVRIAIHYIQKVLKLQYIYGDTMGRNTRMQKIFLKLGFRLIYRIEDFYDMNYYRDDRLDYVLEPNQF